MPVDANEEAYTPLAQNGDVQPHGRIAGFFEVLATPGAVAGVTWVRNLAHGAGSVLVSAEPRIKAAQSIALHVGSLCTYAGLPLMQLASTTQARKLDCDIRTIKALINELKILGEPQDNLERLENHLTELENQIRVFQLSRKEMLLCFVWTVCAASLLAQCVRVVNTPPTDKFSFSNVETWEGVVSLLGIVISQALLKHIHSKVDIGALGATLEQLRREILVLIDDANEALEPLEASKNELIALHRRVNQFFRQYPEVLAERNAIVDKELKLHVKLLGCKVEIENSITMCESRFQQLGMACHNVVREMVENILKVFFAKLKAHINALHVSQSSDFHVEISQRVFKFNTTVEEAFNQFNQMILEKKVESEEVGADFENLIREMEKFSEELFGILEFVSKEIIKAETDKQIYMGKFSGFDDELNHLKSMLTNGSVNLNGFEDLSLSSLVSVGRGLLDARVSLLTLTDEGADQQLNVRAGLL
jgi:hypothetical protein